MATGKLDSSMDIRSGLNELAEVEYDECLRRLKELQDAAKAIGSLIREARQPGKTLIATDALRESYDGFRTAWDRLGYLVSMREAIDACGDD